MLQLRALTLADAHITWQWRNREDTKFFFAGHPFPINYEKELQWLETVIYQNHPHTYFGIEHEGNLVGLISLRDIDLIHGKAEFAIFVVGVRGVGREATNLLLRFAFYDLGLQRVWLKVMENNKTAINLYKKCGFVEEGTFRRSVFKNGKYYDQIVFSILKEEFDSSLK
jgi:UDP-4-amino-4,6-dideoxy-N-acetyl-beta-L-altrosamine N-acetyltransferase